MSAHPHSHPQGHDHGHSHPHGHSHAHAHTHHTHHTHHSHPPPNFSRAFAIGIALNVGFVAVEAYYGWKINSLALLADAAHNLSDVAGLLLAWVGALASQRRPDARHTYGWQRGTILAALINAVLLLVAMGSLAWEALGRLQSPHGTEGWTVIVVAAIGIVINTATALLFLRGREDLNIRGAFMHMAADALVSLGVVLGGLLFLWQGWLWIDPVMSLLIAAVIVVGTWGLLRQSLHLMFDGVPPNLNLHDVQHCLLALPGVQAVHDLHIWPTSTSQVALTAHLVLADDANAGPYAHPADGSALLAQAQQELAQRFGIRHCTLQLESAAFAAQCHLLEHGGLPGAAAHQG